MNILPIRDRVIDSFDVPPAPTMVPSLWGPYLVPSSVHWLTGQTGLGKSTLAYNVMAAIAEGSELWGTPTEKRRVLYVDMESGDIGRSIKLERLYADRPRVRGQLLFMPPPLRLPEEMEALVAFAKETGVELVVFDTARRCFQVEDENSNSEVYNRVMPTPDALKAAGIASLIMGHPAKNGTTGARGAGAQEDAGDVNLTLTMHRGEVSDANGIIALRVTKNRLLGLNVPPLYLRRIGDDRFERVEAKEADETLPEPESQSPQERCRADIVDFLVVQSSPVTFLELGKAMHERGHSQSTFERSRTALVSRKTIVKGQDGYLLSDPFDE